MRTLALVPAKRLADAKSRLAAAAGPLEREQVALDMLRAVLGQLARVRGLDGYAVVTADERAAALGRELGAAIVAEPSGEAGEAHRGPLNLALDAGRVWGQGRGAEALLVVLSDLPLAAAGDLEVLIAQPAAVAIAPSKDGGTNALVLRPPDAIPFRFGRDSARYHRFEAEKRGLEVAFVRRDSLAFDVDTPDDLAAYRQVRQQALARP